MKVTYNWLKEFVDIKVSPEELADKLTNVGMEVEEIVYQNKHLHDVHVGKILEIKHHPNADKLDVCQVDVGFRKVQIITSAKNIKEGDLVPVALDGADLVNGVKIKQSTLRGELSQGMFCSGEEIGITEDYYTGAGVNGILILREDYALGEKIEDALGLDDVVFDINITPNRPDCMSVIGIAREVSAILKTPIKDIDNYYEVDKADDINKYLSLEVEDKDLCPRYMATVVKDIVIRESPLWLKKRLNAVGIKTINNMVDITNYVLIEQGQPMHAFDYSFIGGKKIVVKRGNGERLKVLNGNEYTLKPNFLTISDAEKPMVIAGVIGGVNSSVTKDTKISVLEAASFARASVRTTSRAIGVRTDSSARFEKGVDLGSVKNGMETALALVYKLKAGTIVSGVLDVKEYEPKEERKEFSLSKIEKILGIKVKESDAVEILNNLGIKTSISGDTLSCVIPTFRTDIERDADIAEEIIRMYGYDVYDKIDIPVLSGSSFTKGAYDPLLKKQDELKNVLCDNGYFETLNYSFCSADASEKLLFRPEHRQYAMIRLQNPISEDMCCLRTSMAYGILSTIDYNIKHGNKDLKFFEVGRIYIPKALPLTEQPHEINMLSIGSFCQGEDFFTLKGVVEKLLGKFDVKYRLEYSSLPFMRPGISADVIDEECGVILASFGEVHPKALSNFDIDGKVLYAELNIDELMKHAERKIEFKPISKYPYIERDLALVVDESVTAERLLSSIKKSAGEYYVSSRVFDIYRNPALGENKKSVAVRFTLSSQEKTLTDEEINAVMNKMIKDCEYKLGAKLR